MPQPKNVYLYLFDTLADWEIGHLAAGINHPMMQVDPQRHALKTFSVDGAPVRTMGGLQMVPDLSLDAVAPAEAEMLILPGGESWEAGGNREVLELAARCRAEGRAVAGICGATLGMAQAGLLDTVRHTSNSPAYLLASGYKGEGLYQEALAVSDGGIITAPGTGALEFAREIFRTLALYTPAVLEAWYRLFKTGTPEAYAALMRAAGA